MDLLIPFNQSWARDAGALVIVLAHNLFPHNGEFNSSAVFDTGAAWQNFALQASRMGLVTHGMAGFDYERTKQLLNLNKEYEVIMMIAVGKPGDVSTLPAELQKREEPSLRKPIQEFAFEGMIK
jgi:nitroreductase